MTPFTPTARDVERTRDFLLARVEPRLRPGGTQFLGNAIDAAKSGNQRRVFLAFSSAWRFAGTERLIPADDVAAAVEAAALRPLWQPGDGSVLDAVRALVLLHLEHGDGAHWLETLDRLFQGADLAEAVALYRALPILPRPDLLGARCAEGVRTNMLPVFLAVAHGNPFPAERLDDGAWNQMVLKALFVGAPLAPIVGLDDRANAVLARMLTGFARERRAAGRPVPADLWRCVGRHADLDAVAAMEQALRGGDIEEITAARNALRQCSLPAAARVLQENPN